MRRASCQASDLGEFYSHLASTADEVSAGLGHAMLDLLAALDSVAGMDDVWALTSVSTLVLLAADDYRSPWFVRVIGRGFVSGRREWEIQYLMPRADAPWPDAMVAGSTDSLKTAVVMVQTAKLRSGGWVQRQCDPKAQCQ